MQQASLLGLLKIVLTVTFILYAMRILSRILLPLLLRNFVKRSWQKTNENVKKQGSVTIETPSRKGAKKNNKDLGDYIDFEEIKK